MNRLTSSSLEQQRQSFSSRRFLAMPLAGTIVWIIIGLIGATMPVEYAVWAVWIGAGSTFYLGVGISKLTGEDFLAKNKAKNAFDGLFMSGVVMALLVFAIAMPFASIDHTSIPLTVGVLAGLMWMPLSWIIQHWIGYFHAIVRTLAIVSAWYLFPEQRFVVIPAIIVVVYLISIVVLERRFIKQQRNASMEEAPSTS